MANEAADNKFSDARLRLVDALCEGEIEGFWPRPGSAGNSPLVSTFYDNTPVLNVDGSSNFNVSGDGYSFAYTLGTTGQGLISGFEKTESLVPLPGNTKISNPPAGAGLKKVMTVVINTNQYPEADSIRVTVRVPALFIQDDEAGMQWWSVVYKVTVTPNDVEANAESYQYQIFGKCTSPFLRDETIVLPKTNPVSNFTKWKISIERVDTDALTTKVQNTCYVESISVISNNSFTYPNTVLVATELAATQFASVPVRAYEIKGLKIKVPTGYTPTSYGVLTSSKQVDVTSGNKKIVMTTQNNSELDGIEVGGTVTGTGIPANAVITSVHPGVIGDTEVYFNIDQAPTASNTNLTVSVGTSEFHVVPASYPNVWDGTFSPTKKWTNNPAWIFYDIVTNKRYGLGQYVTENQVDKWTLYQIAQYCDELVDDGMGGLEPRFTCNLAIQSRQDAYQLLQNFLSVFQAMMYWNGDQILLAQDRDGTPVQHFTNANVVNGSFTYSDTPRNTRSTVIKVKWLDNNNFYREAVEYVEDVDGIARYGYVEKEVTAFACTSRGQAIRLANWILLTERYMTETVTLQTGLEGVYLRPGDIFGVYDNYRKNTSQGGRVLGYDAARQVITLDRRVNLVSGYSYTLSVTAPSGNLDFSGITGSDQIDQIRASLLETLPLISSGTNTNVVTVDGNFSSNIFTGTTWIVSATDPTAILATEQKYRCLATSEISKGIVEVLGIEYNTGINYIVSTGYSVVQYGDNTGDQSAILPPFNLSYALQTGIQAAPSAERYITTRYAKVYWEPSPSPGIQYYLLSGFESGVWSGIGQTSSTSFTLQLPYTGVYQWAVGAVSAGGVHSTYPTSSISITKTNVFETLPPFSDISVSGDNADTRLGQTGYVGDSLGIQWTMATGGLWGYTSPEYQFLTGFKLHLQNPTTFAELITPITFSGDQNTTSYEISSSLIQSFSGGPRRSFRAYVEMMDTDGTVYSGDSFIVNNPAPTTVDSASFVGISGSLNYAINENDFDQIDLSGVNIWYNASNAFSPTVNNINLSTKRMAGVIDNGMSGVYYVWYSVVDTFGTTSCPIVGPFTVTGHSYNGAPAQYVVVNGQQTFSYSSPTAPTPTPTSITLNASLFGGLTTYDWEWYSGSSWINLTGTQNTSDYVLTPDNIAFNYSPISLRIRCLSSSAYDEITIVKLYDGANGTNGAGAIAGYITNETSALASDNDGTNYSLTNAGGTFKMFSGTSDVSASSSYLISGGSFSTPYWTKAQNGLTLRLHGTNGTYDFSGASWTSDTESFNMSGVYGSSPIVKTCTISKSKRGAGAFNGLLTNESFAVPADSAGTVSSYAGASGTFETYSGVTRLLAGVTYATGAFTAGVAGSINSGNGIYTVTAVTADVSTLELKATYGSTVLSKIFSITKQKTGATGTTGTRGSKAFYASSYSAWDDTAANNAIINAGLTKVDRDQVTLYNTTNFSQTKYWDASANGGLGAWTGINSVIDGSLVVNGTISGNKLVAQTVTASEISPTFGTLSLTSGGLVMAANGSFVRAGQTAYNVGTGFWLGNVGGTGMFSIGDPSTNSLTWNGTTLNVNGTITAVLGHIGGFTISSTYLANGKTSLSDASAGVYLGNDGISLGVNSPFKVTNSGVLTATSGTVGGWTLGTSKLYNGRDTLASTNAGIYIGTDGVAFGGSGAPVFQVTSAGVLSATSGTIGGCLLASNAISSTTYVAGALGAGWQINNAGTAEFQNVTIRGSIRTSVFEKDTISAVNGTVLISKADVLASDMTAQDSSTVTISGETTFVAGEVLRVKDGTYDEWMLVTSAASAPTYTVTRDLAATYNSNANPAWKKGTAIVSMGIGSGAKSGFISLNSSDANSPYIDIYQRTGTNWYEYGVGATGTNSATGVAGLPNVRLGWLQGIVDTGVGLSGTDVWGLYSNSVYLKGKIVADTGYIGGIGGWVVGTGTISSNNITLTSGPADTANITVGSGSNSAGLNSPSTGTGVAFWAGDTFANRASAPYYVTAAGQLVATSVKISTGGGSELNIENGQPLTYGNTGSAHALINNFPNSTSRIELRQATATLISLQTADLGGPAYVGTFQIFSSDHTTKLQIQGGVGSSAPRIVWGGDTNLYRSAADTLKTDDGFIASGIDSTPIGATTPAAGSFTTLSASSTVSGSGFSTYLASPPAIGGTAAAAGTFTTLTATSSLLVQSVTSSTRYLSLASSGTLTANRTLTFIVNDADRTLTVAGTASISGTNTGDQTTISGNAGTATALQTARSIYGNNFDGTANLAQIIASTYGGTGNGFTKFSGPTTSEKTFTLPDSSVTLLYSGGALGTPSSGTVTNLTGTASININGTVGATTPASGAFTTLSASSTVSGTGFSTYLASPPAIGGTAAAAGTFTVLKATSGINIYDLQTSRPTYGGSLVITEYQTSLNAQAGIEFQSRWDGSGYGWRMSSLSNAVDFVWESRANTATWTERARLTNAGGFALGTTADPGAGGIYATGNITAYYSDIRLKNVLGVITNPLQKIEALTGFYYKGNETAKSLGYKSDKVEIGVSAQAVESVMPELVSLAPISMGKGTDYKTLDYARLTPLLIEAIKALKAEVDDLKKQLKK